MRLSKWREMGRDYLASRAWLTCQAPGDLGQPEGSLASQTGQGSEKKRPFTQPHQGAEGLQCVTVP